MAQVVYTGSMTERSPYFPDAAGEGIVVWYWDDDADALRRIQTTADIANPSWLAIDARHLRLYATSELHDSTNGTVRAYDIDAGTGRLTAADTYESAGSATIRDRSGVEREAVTRERIAVWRLEHVANREGSAAKRTAMSLSENARAARRRRSRHGRDCERRDANLTVSWSIGSDQSMSGCGLSSDYAG